jgi:hypothetical protein
MHTRAVSSQVSSPDKLVSLSARQTIWSKRRVEVSATARKTRACTLQREHVSAGDAALPRARRTRLFSSPCVLSSSHVPRTPVGDVITLVFADAARPRPLRAAHL